MALEKKSPKKAPKKTVKPAAKKVSARLADNGLRLRRLKPRQDKKRQKDLALQKKLPSAWAILMMSLKQLYKYKRLFIGILLVYIVLSTLLVKGISGNFQLASLKSALKTSTGKDVTGWKAGLSLFGPLLGTAGTTTTETAGLYQAMLIIIISLSLIWAVRQTYDNQKTRFSLRSAFYESAYPLIPFLLTVLNITLRLIPMLLTTALYSQVRASGAAITGLEQAVWFLIFIGGIAASLYLLAGVIFSIFIATLPQGRPLASIRASKELTRFRHFDIARKILFLPFVILLAAGILLVPLITFAAPLAEVVFVVYDTLALAVVYSYLYTLYRSIL